MGRIRIWQWSDGYVWRTPYKDRVYQYSTNLKDKIEDKDKGGYSFGRKQLYYLDKINTKEKTALFVKELREDSYGKNLKFKFSNSTHIGLLGQTVSLGPYLQHTGDGANASSLKYTNPDIHVRENGVEYKREYSLKLSKIILVKSEDGKNLSKATSSSSSSNLASSYGNFGNTYIPNSSCSPNWESPYFTQVYGSNYSYGIHNENQVLDIRDIPSSFIQNNALKVIEFDHSYDLAKSSPSSSEVSTSNNPNNAKLTLNSVLIKGREGYSYMPATKFDYYMEDLNNLNPSPLNENQVTKDDILTYVEDQRDRVDNWGFQQGTHNGKNKAIAWSLKEITMPTGAKINIDYEEDDYWLEAFSRPYWQSGLQINFKSENGKKYVYFRNNPNNLDPDVIFSDHFDANRSVFLDIQYHRNPSIGSQGRRIADFAGEFNIVSVSSTVLKIELPTEVNNDTRNGATCGSYPWSYSRYYCGSSNLDVCDVTLYDPFGGSPCNLPGNGVERFRYNLLANKISPNQTGGGLRVKELQTISDGNTYKVHYDYSHPTENRTSGITSYAPISGLKYVPYQTELPSPGVMYEYVTMKEAANDGSYVAKTRYRHHVLKPVNNIFNPNFEMEALSSDAPNEDRLFWANVTEEYGGLNGNNLHNISSKKIDIHVNSALIGQIKSIEKLNSEDHVLMRTDNEYINGIHLNGTGPNNEPNKGYVKETFNSMKTVFQTNDAGTVIEDEKRLLSISSRTDYNNMLKKTITYAGGNINSVEYEDVDPWLGSFRRSKSTMADGTAVMNYRVPAYTYYSDMQSKALNHNNKNMLTQEAMSIASVKIGTQWKTTNANITTWNNNWTYRSETGTEFTPTASSEKIWRKHKNFIWKEAVDPVTGVYNTYIDQGNTYFNWGTGTPTSSKWQEVSEITRYNHWSTPQETKDINGNYASSKMADNWSKTVATGNARYTEMYASGVEYPILSGSDITRTEDEFTYSNCSVSSNVHTGNNALELKSNGKAFRITGSVTSGHTSTGKFRSGKYKVSFWRYNPLILARSNSSPTTEEPTLMVNGVAKNYTHRQDAGDWTLYNFIIDIEGSTTDIYVKGPSSGYHIIDDYRIHPIYASINSYIYDQKTDDLISILDANNLATKFEYDKAGRLIKTYSEVMGTFYGDSQGGFKLVQENNYNYKNQ